MGPPSTHPGRNTTSTPSGCLPFARVLGADGRLLRQAHQALIPGFPLWVVCECPCGLLTLAPQDGDELAGALTSLSSSPER